MEEKVVKYSKTTICRQIEKCIGDLAVDKRKENKRRPLELSVLQKRKIIRQTKIVQVEMGNFCAKRMKVRAGIPPSVSDEIVQRVLKKAAMNWRHAQKKGILI